MSAAASTIEVAPVEAGSMVKRVAGNSAWLIAQPLLLNVLSIGSTAYIARKLGASQFGDFSLGFAQVALFTPLCSLGLRGVAVRAVARERERAQQVVGALFALRLLFTAAAVLLALGWLCLPTYPLAVRLVGLAAVVSMVCQTLGMVAVDLFQGCERSRLAAQPRMIGGVVLTLLSVVALLLGTGLTGFTAAYVIGAAVQLVLLWSLAWRHFFPLRPAWDWTRIRGYSRELRPFALLSVLTSLTDVPVVDVLILGALFAAGKVGAYAAAIGLVLRLLMIPQGIGDALYPAVAAGQDNREAVSDAVRKSLLNLLLLTLPVALCLSLSAPTVLWMLFGNKYLSATGALRVAAWLVPLGGLSYAMRECLNAVHRQGTVVRYSLISAALVLALYAALIPLLGVVGAALAGVLREVVMLPMWTRCLRGELESPLPLRKSAKLIPALAAMAVPFAPLLFGAGHLYTVAAAALSFVMYSAVVLRTGIVDVSSLPGVGRIRLFQHLSNARGA